MVHRWTLVAHAMLKGKKSKGTWQTTNKGIISNDVVFSFWLDSVRRASLSSMQGLCHKSDLLQRAYLKWTRHGVNHGWLEGVGKRDDCNYLKNRELSDDDDDRSENVAKKLNLPRFKCYRVYLELLNLSNVGDFSWSWILKDFIQYQKEKGEFVVECLLSL